MSVDDAESHRKAKERLKALRHRRLAARRWHCHCTVTLDTMWHVLISELDDAPMAERPSIIAKWEAEMAPYFKPQLPAVDSAEGPPGQDGGGA